MSTSVRFTNLLLVAVLAAVSVHAEGVILSDVGLTARATFSSEQVPPEKSDFDTNTHHPISFFKQRKPWPQSRSIR